MKSMHVVIETFDVLESSLVAELILILSLNHAWSLSPKCSNCLKQVQESLVLEPLQHDT